MFYIKIQFSWIFFLLVNAQRKQLQIFHNLFRYFVELRVTPWLIFCLRSSRVFHKFVAELLHLLFRETYCPLRQTSPGLQFRVLIATQWTLPSCSTWTNGRFLKTLNDDASPRTGSCNPLASGNCNCSIFWAAWTTVSFSILLLLREF